MPRPNPSSWAVAARCRALRVAMAAAEPGPPAVVVVVAVAVIAAAAQALPAVVAMVVVVAVVVAATAPVPAVGARRARPAAPHAVVATAESTLATPKETRLGGFFHGWISLEARLPQPSCGHPFLACHDLAPTVQCLAGRVCQRVAEKHRMARHRTDVQARVGENGGTTALRGVEVHDERAHPLPTSLEDGRR